MPSPKGEGSGQAGAAWVAVMLNFAQLCMRVLIFTLIKHFVGLFGFLGVRWDLNHCRLVRWLTQCPHGLLHMTLVVSYQKSNGVA